MKRLGLTNMKHTLQIKVDDETVIVIITKCNYTPPDRNTWTSNIDYNGGYDMEYLVYDLQGNMIDTNAYTEDKIDQEIINWYLT